MASKKRRRPPLPSRPAKWFLDLGKAKARQRARQRVEVGMLDPDEVPAYVASAGQRQRLSTRDYLSRTAKDVRRYFTGFTAKDGYNLSNIHTWPKARADAVRRYGEYLHQLQSAPYVDVSPKRYRGVRRQRFKKVLQERLQQGSRRQKKYLYHVEQTKRPTEVRLGRTGELEVREPFKDTYFLRREWYFRDYLPHRRQPQSFDDIVRATTRMLDDLPDLWFSIIDTTHGPIDVPVQKQFLVTTLRRYFEEYQTHTGFESALIGVMFLGTREEAMAGYNERLRRRMQQQFAQSERGKEIRRRIAFQKRMGRVR